MAVMCMVVNVFLIRILWIHLAFVANVKNKQISDDHTFFISN